MSDLTVGADQSSSNTFTIALMQLNPLVGDINGNVQRMLAALGPIAVQNTPTIAVFSELVLVGYPPEDLLLRPSLQGRISVAIEQLLQFSNQFPKLYMVFGTPLPADTALGQITNSALVIHSGAIVCQHNKYELPNYRVFDEKRYFTPSPTPTAGVFKAFGVQFGLSVCEDIWFSRVTRSAVEQGATILLNLNASPFHQGKQAVRQAVIQSRIAEAKQLGAELAVVYVNQVGGQDELIFDGGSFVACQDGFPQVLPRFEVAVTTIEYDVMNNKWLTPVSTLQDNLSVHNADEALDEVFQALVLGTQDYVLKNGFQKVLLGLSGGIDSALTLAIAVAALGADNVQAVMMPFTYTSPASIADAQEQAQRLSVHYSVRSIAAIFDAILTTLAPDFKDSPADITEENIQARCRGVLLMALSNKTGAMVLTTGNKSEMAVGYSTLYGDMAGGLDVLKDVPKTMVYNLARYLNKAVHLMGGDVIPVRVIERAPSAELRPDQTDQDSLPDYAELDDILSAYIEHDQSAEQIIAAGFDQAVVYDVIGKVDRNEHKRRQAPPGLRITQRAFGRDRRYPITSGWQAGH